MRETKNLCVPQTTTRIRTGLPVTILAAVYIMFMAFFVSSCSKSDVNEPSIDDALVAAGINEIFPANAADSVEVNPVVSVTYNANADPAAVAATTITLKKGGVAVPGTLAVSGKTATFSTASDLAPESQYTATVKTSKSGTSDSYEYSWGFRTGRDHHYNYLSVTSISPANAATDVSVTAPIVATFNQDLSSTMKKTTSILLKNGTQTVAGALTFSGNTATFIPSVSLAASTLYTGKVIIGASADNDDKSDHNFNWSFTTGGSGADVTAPKVSAVVPAINATAVAITSNATVTFSEIMNSSTVTAASFTMKQGTTAVTGTVTCSGNSATFAPFASLAANTVYTATITTAAKDAAGNALAANYTWNFTTAAGADVTAPTVVSANPANNATAVAITASPAVVFSEAMNASTITSSTFTLKQGATAVAGTVTYSGTTATFKPSAALSASTVYTGTITTGAKDAAGNILASNYTWSFTTAAQADVTAPTVLSVAPANSATSVAVSIRPAATFSEAMGSASVTTSTFTLKQGTTSVAGTVSLSGSTATFTPSSALANNMVYTATITTGAKDAAGNALASNYTWSFTTAAQADVTAPTVSSVTPGNNATGVAVNSKATVSFSEAMSASSMTTSTFTMKQGSTTVAGTVSYTGMIATFTPSSALAGGTVYTMTVTTGAKDAAGNAIASNYSWSFTTVAVATGVSFAGEVVPILNICNTCHTHPWTPSTNATTFYNSLVSGGYVNTSSPTSSKIYTKLNGGHPGSTVTTAQVNTILTWFTQGAKNN